MKKLLLVLFTLIILINMSKTANADDVYDSSHMIEDIEVDCENDQDTEENYCFVESYGDFLLHMKILQGNNAGDLMPEKDLTREEFVSIIMRIYKTTDYEQEENEKESENMLFTDIDESHWAYEDISKACRLGIANGIGDGKFGIGQKINQQQATAFIIKYLNYDIAWDEVAEKADEILHLKLDDENTQEFKRAHAFELLAKTMIIPNSSGDTYIERKYLLENEILREGHITSEDEILMTNEINKVKLLIEEKLKGSTEKILRGSIGQVEYYIHELRPEYLAYKLLHEDYADEKIVLDVNMSLNKMPYEQVENALDVDKLTVLCNKHYRLDDEYESEYLVEIDDKYHIKDKRKYFLDSRILDDYKSMYEAAKLEGIKLSIASAYRSYNYQKGLFQIYKNRYGQEDADTFSARAGHSEHQTGLAFDLYPVKEKFQDTEAFAWLTENASTYGFILRYPKGKESITGYMYEPWHYRYVGKEIAEKIKAENLCYDEYYAKYLLKKRK